MLRESARDGWCALSGRRIVSASHLGAAGRTKPPPCRFPLSPVDSWQCSSRDFNVLLREEHRRGAGALPAVRATAIELERRLRRASVRDFPAPAPTVAFRGCGSSAADEGARARPPGWMEGHADTSSLKAQYRPMAICTANAAKRIVTAVALVEARWMRDWNTRAARKTQASWSVMAVLPVATATSSRPPKIGRPSMQLAWALASRCMKGDSPELSGMNPLAGTLPRNTSCVRMTSMSTSRSSAQAMKPVNAIELGEIMAALAGEI